MWNVSYYIQMNNQIEFNKVLWLQDKFFRFLCLPIEKDVNWNSRTQKYNLHFENLFLFLGSLKFHFLSSVTRFTATRDWAVVKRFNSVLQSYLTSFSFYYNFIIQKISMYNQTCVNNHLCTSTTCQKPAWSPTYQNW